ncbi:MAG TPA: hypothetical protein VMJ32_16105 [Pirellulales bacterium]|nr:hypothetical protein [Pirellulales bacterium]
MLVADHYCHGVEKTAIHIPLMREAVKSISVAFDLKAIKSAIDNRNIDSRNTLGKPQFLNNAGFGLTIVALAQVRD